MSWLPIETAPKDGTWFIVWLPHSREAEQPRLARWTRWPVYVDGRPQRPDELSFHYAGCGPVYPPNRGWWHPAPDPPRGSDLDERRGQVAQEGR